MSSAPDRISRILRHERALVLASIAALAGLCWWYVAAEGGLGHSAPMTTMHKPPLGALAVMWSLMMIAMMLPSATPAILLYSRVRNFRASDPAVVQSWVFVAGYLAVWLSFSMAAAVAQKFLIGSSMALESRLAQGAMLLGAGLYQLSPWKAACMRQCRSPGEFLSRHWRPGRGGALRLGIAHGAYCLGCCWMLMGLLFVGGVMNLLWIAGLTLLVTAEKLLPNGDAVRRASAFLFLVWGAGRVVL